MTLSATYILFRTTADEGLAVADTYMTKQQHSQKTDIHAPSDILTRKPSKRTAADQRLKSRGILRKTVGYVCYRIPGRALPYTQISDL
jgi:hypothetical protein